MGKLNMSSESRALTILMVDDSADEIFLTRKTLRSEGIINHFISEKDPNNLFGSIENALASGCGIDRLMIFLDLNMKGKDGFELLKEIRADERLKNVKVIMLTGSDDEADMLECFDLGANGYMVKPFSSPDFFAALSNEKSVRYQLVQ